MTRALITGLTGQDGSYLAEQLAALGWEVHALVRGRVAVGDSSAKSPILHVGDLMDLARIVRVLDEVEPDVVFNLGGISSVATSWHRPVDTGLISGIAVVALLEAAAKLQTRTGRAVRFVQASSSEIFGDASQVPQTESTPIAPVSPYGMAKAYGHQAVSIYRSKGLHASACILYNHESPRRPDSFVTRKITAGAAQIAAGKLDRLMLGNLDLKRDWGWAPDYVDALVRAADASAPGDYVIATGQSHSIREFAAAAFSAVGIEDWENRIGIDQRFVRPADPHDMLGDASKARDVLGWAPTVDFEEIVARMAAHDVELLREKGVGPIGS